MAFTAGFPPMELNWSFRSPYSLLLAAHAYYIATQFRTPFPSFPLALLCCGHLAIEDVWSGRAYSPELLLPVARI